MLVDWPVAPPPDGEPAPADLWLIRTAYEFTADRTRCDRCRHRLGRDLQVVIGGRSRVVVVTRCRGWRRHRHSAVVTDARGDLHLERLHASCRLRSGR